MAYTKTYKKNGFDFKAVIQGKDVDKFADIWSEGEYIGKLYITHDWRGDRYAYWTDTKYTTSDNNLFEAARSLRLKHRRAKMAAQ